MAKVAVSNPPPDKLQNLRIWWQKLSTGKDFEPVLLLLALVGLGLRVLTVLQIAMYNGGRNSFYLPSKFSDQATYRSLADTLWQGGNLGVLDYQPFYYTVFLPLVKILTFGAENQWLAVGLVQAVLGAATVYLGALCAREVAGRIAMYGTAVILTVSATLLVYTPFHLIVTVLAFWLTLGVLAALRLVKKPRWQTALTLGVALGAAIVCRGNMLLLLIPVLAVLVPVLRRQKATGRTWAILLTALLAPVLAWQLPYVAYNTYQSGHLMWISSAADKVLVLGNTPEAPAGGRNYDWGAGAMEYPDSYYEFLSGKDGSAKSKIWRFFREEPVAFLDLQIRKALLFWDGDEVPNNISIYDEMEHSGVLYLCYFLSGNGMMSYAVAFAGLLWFLPRLWRRRPEDYLLAGWLVAFWAATAIFYILSRFRAPILPVLSVFAGMWIEGAAQYFLQRRRKYMYQAAISFFAGAAVCGALYNFYADHLEPRLIGWSRPDGVAVASHQYANLTKVTDHGPVTFGGWQGVKVKQGELLTKYFGQIFWRLDETGEFGPAYVIDRVELQLLAPYQGQVLANTKKYQVATNAQNIVVLENVPRRRNNELAVELRFDAPITVIMDTRRRYGRSWLGNQKLTDGEWVCRAYYRSEAN